jgi:hypothetical protein
MKTVILTVLMLIGVSPASASDVNSSNMSYYQDSNGNSHYTDTPMVPSFKPRSYEQNTEAKVKSRGAISADTLPAIRKRVLKANKILSKRLDKGPLHLPLSPVDEAAFDQLILNSKISNIKDKGFLAECHYDKANDGSRRYVTCNMFFPGKYSVGNVPMRYVHYIESVSLNVARSFRGPSTAPAPSSYQIMALVNVEGDYAPVCSFIYDKEFDSITPLYTSQ